MFGSEIYGTRKLMMAPPAFFVLYFDKPDAPDVQVVRLTEHYTEKAPGAVKHNALKCCASDRGPTYDKLKFIELGLSIQ